MFEVAGAYGYTSDIPKIPMQGCPYLWGFLDSICSYAPTLFLLALSGTLHSPMFYHIYLYTTIQRPREKNYFYTLYFSSSCSCALILGFCPPLPPYVSLYISLVIHAYIILYLGSCAFSLENDIINSSSTSHWL